MGQANVRKKEIVPGTVTIMAKISFTYLFIKKGKYVITAIEKSTKKPIGEVYIILNSENPSNNTYNIMFDHSEWPMIKHMDDIIFEVIGTDDELITFNGKNVTILFTKKIIE